MKKIITLVLALVLVFAMSVSVFAAESVVVDNRTNSSNTEGEKEGTVTINLSTATGVAAKVYYVVVEWENLVFEYDFGAEQPVWDPTTHTYKTETPAGSWKDGTADSVTQDKALTVANHSNAAVNVTTTVDAAKYGITVDLVIDSGDTSLETADTPARIDNYSAADKVVYDVTVSGTPTTTTQTIFNIKVTINPA